MSSALPLETLSASGKPPESRLNSAESVHSLVHQMIRADESRSKVRARVKGLIDGNAPYSQKELRDTGQAYRTNINFRESEGFLASATSAFYDVFSEVPHYATVKLKHDDDQSKAEAYGRIATEEFDRLQKEDEKFDFTMQLSQHEMVLYGSGPLIFENGLDWRCKAIRSADLLVPDGSASNVSDWPLAVIRSRYAVHELYSFIKNEAAASESGWNMKIARKAIMDAIPDNNSTRGRSWEHQQQQIRNNDLSFSAKCDTILAAHVLYREFPNDEHPEGAISHCIILESDNASPFLYRRLNRYKNWGEALHVMYYDKGDGQHHSVKGMGIKMYSALELKNRFSCSLVDSAFARTQIIFQPTTPDAMQKTGVVQMGPYAIMPPGFNVVQSNMSGVLDAPIAVARELEQILQSNLSQYRQKIDKPGGNPRTATEINAILAQQATLGKTQLTRYYEQLDGLFAERYRRATSKDMTKSTPGGEAALAFQKRCKDRGMPLECLRKIVSVRATRTIGQGSAAMRQSVITDLLGFLSMLPESGRQNLLQDMIASRVGQQHVQRYLPEPMVDVKRDDQTALAMLENAALKENAPVLVTNTQMHIAHIQAHLQAGAEAAQSLEGGQSDQMQIAVFLPPLIGHISQHLQRIATDATRQDAVKAFSEQLGQLVEVSEMLTKSQVEQQQQQQEQMQMQMQMQQQAQALQSGADPADQLAQMRAGRDEDRRDIKLQNDMQRKAKKSEQDLIIKDMKAAQSMERDILTMERDGVGERPY